MAMHFIAGFIFVLFGATAVMVTYSLFQLLTMKDKG